MIVRVLAYLAKPATIAVVRRLGSTWLFSFVAASGAILARRWHREQQQQQRPPMRQRPYTGPNVWRRPP